MELLGYIVFIGAYLARVLPSSILFSQDRNKNILFKENFDSYLNRDALFLKWKPYDSFKNRINLKKFPTYYYLETVDKKHKKSLCVKLQKHYPSYFLVKKISEIDLSLYKKLEISWSWRVIKVKGKADKNIKDNPMALYLVLSDNKNLFSFWYDYIKFVYTATLLPRGIYFKKSSSIKTVYVVRSVKNSKNKWYNEKVEVLNILKKRYKHNDFKLLGISILVDTDDVLSMVYSCIDDIQIIAYF